MEPCTWAESYILYLIWIEMSKTWNVDVFCSGYGLLRRRYDCCMSRRLVEKKWTSPFSRCVDVVVTVQRMWADTKGNISDKNPFVVGCGISSVCILHIFSDAYWKTAHKRQPIKTIPLESHIKPKHRIEPLPINGSRTNAQNIIISSCCLISLSALSLFCERE